MKKQMLAGIVAASLFAVALTGCSDEGANAGSGPNDVTIGVIPGADLAPLYLGLDQGFFAEEGITLRINSLASKTSGIITAVAEGNYDFGYSDALSLLTALEAKQPVSVIGGAASTSGDTSFDYAAIIVGKDSPITNLADLTSHSVGIDSLRTTNDLLVRNAIDAAGGSSASIELKEVAFIDAVQAISEGTVDAALVVEPFATEARMSGMRVLSYPYAEFDPALTVSAYFTSSAIAKDDPELVERFTAALTKSIDYAEASDYDVRDNINTYIGAGADVRSRLALPVFSQTIDRGAADKLVAAATKYGMLREQPDLDSILP
ncbi:NitT/TauT family transport system substrate-binding protein [Homoserinimonas aerilata]|uniref:NitT/TauT family transport system substrate-binding protein n=1 Tax=Homoserinimonas aerilata TaxID=1162970 RepID=A0A542YFY0_9MICO|nr:ABC transporter substrate-binding protein [Homoserinimonas aerilata]TQL46988.1 NitT/TauT family transport system substrate-binding protein [Homoserinimonas aerilata]